MVSGLRNEELADYKDSIKHPILLSVRYVCVVRESGCLSERVLSQRAQRVRFLSVVSSARYTRHAKKHII